MRTLLALVLVGCSLGPGVGSSAGSLQLVDSVDGEMRDVIFDDGGALSWEHDGYRYIAASTDTFNFTCTYAKTELAGLPGRKAERRGRHYEFVWNSFRPRRVMVYSTHNGVLGQRSESEEVHGTIDRDLEDQLTGTMSSDYGSLDFAAHDCGTF